LVYRQTTLVLLMFIAVWAIIIGATQIWGAIALRKALQLLQMTH
jgi:hypothetical protein